MVAFTVVMVLKLINHLILYEVVYMQDNNIKCNKES